MLFQEITPFFPLRLLLVLYTEQDSEAAQAEQETRLWLSQILSGTHIHLFTLVKSN
jgi:hypothetical protein